MRPTWPQMPFMQPLQLWQLRCVFQLFSVSVSEHTVRQSKQGRQAPGQGLPRRQGVLSSASMAACRKRVQSGLSPKTSPPHIVAAAQVGRCKSLFGGMSMSIDKSSFSHNPCCAHCAPLPPSCPQGPWMVNSARQAGKGGQLQPTNAGVASQFSMPPLPSRRATHSPQRNSPISADLSSPQMPALGTSPMSTTSQRPRFVQMPVFGGSGTKVYAPESQIQVRSKPCRAPCIDDSLDFLQSSMQAR